MEASLSELAELVGATVLSGDPDANISGFAALGDAQHGDVSFFGNEKYIAALRKTAASAVLVPVGFEEPLDPGMSLLAVENPSVAFAKIVAKYAPQQRPFVPGVHPSAQVHQTVSLNPEKVRVGACAVVEADCTIGDGTDVGAGSFIGAGTSIGSDCRIHANVSVYHDCTIGNRVILHSGAVIGGDGFGFEMVEGRRQKIEQIGTVRLDADVEIGAGTTVDRARFGQTWIGEGTKLDCQVQVAHNVVLGKHCVAASFTAFAGSCRIGDYVTVAGQVGIAGHVEVCGQCVIGARSGVTKDITEPGFYLGFPAQPAKDERRQVVLQRRLSKIISSIKSLESKVKDLSGKA